MKFEWKYNNIHDKASIRISNWWPFVVGPIYFREKRQTHWHLFHIFPTPACCILWVLFDGMHNDVIKWKHFPRYWPFVQGIHRSPVNSPHKGQWRGALMFTLICVWIKGCVNNREAGDLRRYCAHYDVTVMILGLIYSMRTKSASLLQRRLLLCGQGDTSQT